MDDCWIKTNIDCCACKGTLETSEDINVVWTEKLATWDCPVFKHFADPNFKPRAVAIICDECKQAEAKIRFCVEWDTQSYEVTYHEIDSLLDSILLSHYFRRNLKREFMLRRSQQLSAN